MGIMLPFCARTSENKYSKRLPAGQPISRRLAMSKKRARRTSDKVRRRELLRLIDKLSKRKRRKASRS